jgi:hypothetical protein
MDNSRLLNASTNIYSFSFGILLGERLEPKDTNATPLGEESMKVSRSLGRSFGSFR